MEPKETPFGEGGIFDPEKRVPVERELPSTEPEESGAEREMDDTPGVGLDLPETGEEEK